MFLCTFARVIALACDASKVFAGSLIASIPGQSQLDLPMLRKHIEQAAVLTRGKPRQLNISMSKGRNSATIGGTMISPDRAAAKLAEPQTLAAALMLAAADADIPADNPPASAAEAEAEAEAPTEAEAEAEAAKPSAAEKSKPGAKTPNPKSEMRNSRGVKKAINSSSNDMGIMERTDASKARLALIAGIAPASIPTDADKLRSMPSPAMQEA